MCEWLKTVSLLKSEFTKEKIKPKKLVTTKKNWRKVKKIIFLSKSFEFLKFFIPNKITKKEKQSPKFKE